MPPLESPDDGSGEAAYVSIPRGGPIYVADMLSPLTTVPDFELSVFRELQNLKAEIDSASLDSRVDNISVDELKILREEELVNKAFEEAFKDGEAKVDSGDLSGEPSSSGTRDGSRPLGFEDGSTDVLGKRMDTSESSSALPFGDSEKTKSNSNDLQKRKRKHVQQKTDTLEESYMAKVEELARIKQEQDQDKAAARLHSFNGSCQTREQANISKKNEKMTSLKGTCSAKARPSNGHGYMEVHFPEVVLCVEVYHNKRTSAKAQEFLVLGRQFLTEVRDKIYCMTDEIMKKAGQIDPSGYFLIEDVFCNDMREPSATDYSKPILHWLENSKNEALEKWEYIVNGELQRKQKALVGSETKLQLPRFRSVEMQKTRFCDLRFQLGAGYIYCHQGECKHVIVIRDMRLVHPEDVQNRAAYPLITFQSKLRFRKCSVCKIFKAEKMTVDDKWAEENPCYFCDLCYYMLHYVNGTLLYNDFSVYDYLHE